MVNWRGMLTRYASEGRVVLRQVLQSPVLFTPFEENGRGGYCFKGSASLVGLCEGTLEVIGMASPPGLAPDAVLRTLQPVFEGEARRRAA